MDSDPDAMVTATALPVCTGKLKKNVLSLTQPVYHTYSEHINNYIVNILIITLQDNV